MKKIGKSDTPNPKEERTNSKRILIIMLIIAAFAITTVCTLWLVNEPITNNLVSGDIFPGSGDAVSGHLPKMTDSEIREQMQREADRSKFSFKINSRPIFNNGTSAGTLQIENPNHNLYPFVVKIVLDKNGEEVYNSGGILPNHHINTATLTTALPKGSHSATAYIQAYDPETNIYTGQSAVALTLIINN